jgi:carboxypeptidase Taq
MTALSTPAYQELAARQRRLYRLLHLQAIASWDQAANMPPKGNEARGEALSELATLLHRLRTDAAQGELIRRAHDEALDDDQRANLREIERQWHLAVAVPEALVEAQVLAASRCEHAWRTQRRANDWAGFLANFREVLRLAREEARILSASGGLAPYDALMDRFEPGMTSAEVDRIFGALRSWLPGLIDAVIERQAREAVVSPAGPFPKAAQRALSLEIMKRMGFDFEAGRLDESAHPFSGGVPEDVRLTTRYSEDDFLQSLLGTIHETGHARYEQNLPAAWRGQPVAQARSMGIHESQSLSFEMQIARSPAFAGLLSPLLVQHFGAQPAFAPDNLARLLTRVKRSLVRVDADEVTYPAHVLLRYEIERGLIEGAFEAEAIPQLWDRGMNDLLGLDTRGNYSQGPLQDIHWAGGSFGYFPSYTLGAMYAAQWFASIRRETPDLDARMAGGDFGAAFGWLERHVWQQASRWPTRELVVKASGGPLDPSHYEAHLRRRYLGEG